jgi:hypothetical protein
MLTAGCRCGRGATARQPAHSLSSADPRTSRRLRMIEIYRSSRIETLADLLCAHLHRYAPAVGAGAADGAGRAPRHEALAGRSAGHAAAGGGHAGCAAGDRGQPRCAAAERMAGRARSGGAGRRGIAIAPYRRPALRWRIHRAAAATRRSRGAALSRWRGGGAAALPAGRPTRRALRPVPGLPPRLAGGVGERPRQHCAEALAGHVVAADRRFDRPTPSRSADGQAARRAARFAAGS